MALYDLHTHTTMTDGEMLPIELIRRMSVLGYSTVAITDHADATNLHELITALKRLVSSAREYGVTLLPGVELTHVPPGQIPGLADEAKKHGAIIVVVHGETPMEPVAPGTNQAACSCSNVDVLAHPGLISLEDACMASDNGVALEITSRGGHNRTNGRCGQNRACIRIPDCHRLGLTRSRRPPGHARKKAGGTGCRAQ